MPATLILVEVNVLPVGDLFQSYRPDIAIACADSIYIIIIIIIIST